MGYGLPFFLGEPSNFANIHAGSPKKYRLPPAPKRWEAPHRARWHVAPLPPKKSRSLSHGYLVAHPTARKWVITLVIYMG